MKPAQARPSRRRLWGLLACLLAAGALAGCERADLLIEAVRRVAAIVNDTPMLKPAPARDFVAEPLGLPEPEHEKLDAWYEGPLPSPLAQTRTNLRRAFFAGDFETVDRAFAQAHAAYVRGETALDETDPMFAPFEDTGMAGIDRCDQWIRAMPRSYAAFYICGRIWQKGAWMARTHEYARDVSKTQFDLMRSRLTRSNELLEQAIHLDDKPIQAITQLANNLRLLSQRKQAQAKLEEALAMMPAHGPAHEVAALYAMPEWGGSSEEVQAAIQRARRSGAHRNWIVTLEDHQLMQPWKTPTPGAEKSYWEKAIAEHVTYQRLVDFASYYVGLENWSDALPVLDRTIREYPEKASRYYWRAHVHEKLGDAQAALADYRLAAALGDEQAINHLIYDHLQGRLARPSRDLAAVAHLCRHAAGLGSPGGANCLGATHWDGSLPGVARDNAQALAWHLLASRGGNWNSQHDLGWVLMSRKVPEVTAPDAHAIGMFWLQRSAEQGHTFAVRKLQDAGIALDSENRRRR